jgi:hypothetical protein
MPSEIIVGSMKHRLSASHRQAGLRHPKQPANCRLYFLFSVTSDSFALLSASPEADGDAGLSHSQLPGEAE